ncbi:type IV pilus secretin PilQ [Vibrio sp. WXL210]|uniref:type IV pilus secretin PilQ n=1 Tax=Vibrio sp. WXL210 TaxID=3450709 RepID=UPI003EC5D107
MSRNRFSRFLLVVLLAVVSCIAWGRVANANPQSNPVSANQLLGVDFQLTAQRQALVKVALASPNVALDVSPSERELTITLFDTSVADSMLNLFDVTDFATLVESIEVMRLERQTQLVIKVSEPFEFEHQLAESGLEVVLWRAPVNAIQRLGNQEISLNFQHIAVRDLLQMIADYNNFNLVVSDAVEGHLTLRLEGVPWQQVLDIVLQAKGLDKRLEGNVMLVAPVAELAETRQARAMGALVSRVFAINFASAADVAQVISAQGEQGLLSPRGSVTVDQRTNSLLVRDVAVNLDEIEAIVTALDIPVKQVQIEARIVSISEGNLDELGVRWGLRSVGDNYKVGATIEGNQDSILDVDRALDELLNVNLAVSAASASSIAFQVAKLGSDTLLDLELSALQRESKAEIISSPRLLTTNKTPAYIEQGTEIPYLEVEAASSGATSVSFKKAVLSLEVTPQITPDNRLVLDLSVTQDRPGEVVKTGTGEAVAINTQRIGTQVLVEDGETVVLGGIYQHSVSDATEKVPLLGDIPLFGALFRRTYQQLGKSELLIFVTPKVVPQAK